MYIAKWKNCRIRFLIIFLASFLLQIPMPAQPSYALNDVLAMMLLNNPELGSFSYDMRAGDAKILQAGFRPNPVIDVESENINTPEFRQTTFLLSQLIEIGGKRRARRQVARTERDKVLFDYEVKKRQLFIETALLFIDVLINQQKVIFLLENLRVLQDFAEVVEKRIEIGKASVIEEANYIVLLNTSLIDLKSAQNELKNAKFRLSAQWGAANNDGFVAIGNLDWIPDIISLEKLGSYLHEHPQIERSYFEDNIRTARIAFENSKAYPDVNVRGGPRYLDEARKWVWVVGVALPIPINDRNQGRIWESQVDLEKLETEREAIWIKLLTDLNTSYSTIQSSSSELLLLNDIILPAAQRAYDYGYKGYESARYNYLELIETERVYRTSKIRHLQSLGEYHKALAMLQGLTGSDAIINQHCESYEQ